MEDAIRVNFDTLKKGDIIIFKQRFIKKPIVAVLLSNPASETIYYQEVEYPIGDIQSRSRESMNAMEIYKGGRTYFTSNVRAIINAYLPIGLGPRIPLRSVISGKKYYIREPLINIPRYTLVTILEIRVSPFNNNDAFILYQDETGRMRRIDYSGPSIIYQYTPPRPIESRMNVIKRHATAKTLKNKNGMSTVLANMHTSARNERKHLLSHFRETHRQRMENWKAAHPEEWKAVQEEEAAKSSRSNSSKGGTRKHRKN